ncbi:MAG TPA: sigma 54-interacting transcriptional regulator [Polyangiaceae bacterium LLY-WYZ-15_(1-7)]|nr:sigma 54-interacting transcriptional regulator [Polyangiaceae bacterium LLY-WYZ-15_(1-7)]HJL07142.1 sigma 54-interacting transcriptional regulator [Polyangiaceae bacterium LLY-WYZ-15_(1-7)]HJL34157.1 sigma 54-interacting transcriptional regulator [Polyangiaceae bacterium LLY-WYZ-15_(1-7)]HJL49578.1 sigma 54-interacting transcriptional regulator [Polyangiaceae bacterium LLY-WYZ-15_(1-7)]
MGGGETSLTGASRRVLETFARSLDGETFLEDCLDVLVEVLRADRGLILRLGAEGESFAIHARTQGRRLAPTEQEELSKTVVREAAEASGAILWDPPAADADIIESVHHLGILRALAAPLRAPGAEGSPAGVVYLDFRRPEKLPRDAEREFLDVVSALMGAMLAQHDALHRTRAALTEARSEMIALDAPNLDELLELPGLAALRRDVEAFARGESNILIEGESGTGKTLLARAIAETSERRPIVRATLGGSDDLNTITSELFGHERGAFSGAVGKRVGLVEHADGGTLILDEVLNLPLRAQQLLLDFTQFGTYRPLGHAAAQAKKARVRIIAATNGDLPKAVAEGRFREDLYYRLAGATLVLPPLRERREDAPALAERFLRQVAGSDWRLAMSFRRLLAWDQLPWPGNVRQLEAVVRRAKERAALREEKVVRVEDVTPRELGVLAFPDDLLSPGPSMPPPAPSEDAPTGTPAERLDALKAEHERLEEQERKLLAQTLQRHDGVVARAAKALGMSRTSLVSRLSTLGIER